MTSLELIYGLVLGLAAIGGFIIEWRRGSDFGSRIAALEAQDLPLRVATVEAVLERVRRSV